MRGVSLYGLSQSRQRQLVARTCRAELRNALQRLAEEAGRREEEAGNANSEPLLELAEPPLELAEPPLELAEPLLQGLIEAADTAAAAAAGPAAVFAAPATSPAGALLCSQGWRQAALARAAASAYVRRAVRQTVTSIEQIGAGVDAVCTGVRDVEASLAGNCSGTSCKGEKAAPAAASAAAGGMDGTWPEACWPVPHMPFNDGGSIRGRKYLVFAISGEQLSNSRSHLVEAARIARATGRILVLPKASRSRLSLALSLPLCAYFDLSHFDSHWVSPDLFLLLARAAAVAPSAAAPTATATAIDTALAADAAAAAPAAPSVGFMVLQSNVTWRMPFTQKLQATMLGELIVYGMGHAPTRDNTFDVIMPANSSTVLGMLNEWHHKDVVVWLKPTWERVDFDPPSDFISFQMLPYGKPWHAMAHRIIARLPARYIAVHYRSEFIAFHLAHNLAKAGWKTDVGVLEEVMSGCMVAARDLINRMKQKHNVTAVFIAADVPFDDKAGSLARSDSWKESTWRFGSSERVMRAPRENLRWLREQVAGTVMVDELVPDINQYDPGVVAIVDKLVCAHAHVFLAGSTVCGGGRGFEQDINSHRYHFNETTVQRWVSQATKLLQQSNSRAPGT
ncbi:hypothetical protein CLOM_g21318 [Closterium sp. NIES-68]|nr:hypothetical protein CLOM_g21318 [Closterium sp. NIES-68]